MGLALRGIEHVGLTVPDLDAALAWAEKCPAAQWGTIEIRPTAVHFTDGQWRGEL